MTPVVYLGAGMAPFGLHVILHRHCHRHHLPVGPFHGGLIA